jgi:hypothetical protein
MSPNNHIQHLFSANALVSVWRNIRNTRDQHDLLLTFQYHPDDVRGSNGKKYTKQNVVETTADLADGKTVDVGGKSIGFVVPWRSMQAQKRELKEKEKELAEALVALASEVAFTGTVSFPSDVRSDIAREDPDLCHRTLPHAPGVSHAEPTHTDPTLGGRNLATDVKRSNSRWRTMHPFSRERTSTQAAS